jgi:hypothetical protein
MGIVKLFWHSLIDQYRKGFRLFRLAPAIVALIIIPEFVQHIFEIQLGMFDSRDAARALANDPTRWAFGYVKIAGLVLTFLASARFWWCAAHGGRWYDLRGVAWGKLLVGLLLFNVIGLCVEPFAAVIAEPMLTILRTIFSLLSLPFLFIFLAGLFGDQTISIADAWKRSWPFVLLLALLLIMGFAPAQLLHGLNHRWALGASPALVWPLMFFDSLVVGLLASLVGAAIAISYMTFHDRLAASSTGPV